MRRHLPFLLLLVVSVLIKMYGFTDHWKRNDHYNWGGIATTKIVRCFEKVPIEVSQGRMILECSDPTKPVFMNHSPAYMYGFWGLTKLFGNYEWVYRLLPLMFSTLCLILMYVIARMIWPNDQRRPLLVVFFQTFFLNMIYFGTHVDVIGELTTSITLLSSIAILKRRVHLACALALLSGLTAWNGFLHFGGLILFALASGLSLQVMAGWTIFAGMVCIGFIGVVKNSWDIIGFINRKVVDPNYIESKTLMDRILFPFSLFNTTIQSLGRALGPLFAVFVVYELFWGKMRSVWTLNIGKLRALPLERRVFILLFTGPLITFLMGPKYFMVHIFLFNFMIPAFAILCADFVDRLMREGVDSVRSKKVFVVLSILFVASYPYGVYQSNIVHDVINSAVLSLSALVFLGLYLKRRLTVKYVWLLLAATAIGNLSQTINYRNEPSTEYSFCEKARKEFADTGRAVRTKEVFSYAKDLYCGDIEIIYEK